MVIWPLTSGEKSNVVPNPVITLNLYTNFHDHILCTFKSYCSIRCFSILSKSHMTRVKENRLFASSDRFVKLKTDLFENFCRKIGPTKFSLWPNFLVNLCMCLVKTDKYLDKCQGVYWPYYIIQLSGHVKWSQKTRLWDLARFRSLSRDYG